jgi:hypothetical protein
VIGKPVGPIVNSFKKMMNDTIMLSAGVTAMAGLNPSEFMTWLEPIVQLSSPMKKAMCVSMPKILRTLGWVLDVHRLKRVLLEDGVVPICSGCQHESHADNNPKARRANAHRVDGSSSFPFFFSRA